MILRGPGDPNDVETYNAQDLQVYDAIAKEGRRTNSRLSIPRSI